MGRLEGIKETTQLKSEARPATTLGWSQSLSYRHQPTAVFCYYQETTKMIQTSLGNEGFIPTLKDFTNSFECFVWSKALLVSSNNDTLTLPNETERTNLYFFHTPIKMRPGLTVKFKGLRFDKQPSWSNHLNQPITNKARKTKNPITRVGNQQARKKMMGLAYMRRRERERDLILGKHTTTLNLNQGLLWKLLLL